MPHIVAVHTGAGNCSHETNKLLKTLCKQVCDVVSKLLADGQSATDAAVAGTLILEDSPLTNAGLGSSITDDKKTRTEASICSRLSGFHCAGDLENVKHPIKVVKVMVDSTLKNSSRYIPPRIMVGQSAVDRYSMLDPTICQTNICTRKSIKAFQKAEKYFSEQQSVKRRKTGPIEVINNLENKKQEELNVKKENKENSTEAPDGVQDTVGVVCLDRDGNFTCTTSSGGSVFKYSGRLGKMQFTFIC